MNVDKQEKYLVTLVDSVTDENKRVDFLPDKHVRLYLCGPTVYNDIHLGNLRPIIVFDVLNRLLVALKYSVSFLHNITDIDDKIITTAIENRTTEKEIATFYTNAYFDVLEKLNVFQKNMVFAKVTQQMSHIERYIGWLSSLGYAYEVNGDVYFDVSQIKNYGVISKQDTSKLEPAETGLRMKRSPLDFAVWKKTEKGINWRSVYSNGRPGWHTECCALVNLFFNDQIDVHGGGVDLKFPHHENENAQHEAIFQKPLARIWTHIGQVLIHGMKMSKSSGNFVLVKNLAKTYSPNAIRWVFYLTKYSNPLDFDSKLIKEATFHVDSVVNRMNVFKSHLIINNAFEQSDKKFEFDLNYIVPLVNDLNTANEITLIEQKIKDANKYLKEKKFSKLLTIYLNLEYLLTNILGLTIPSIHTSAALKSLKMWADEMRNENYEKADKLRINLVEKGLL